MDGIHLSSKNPEYDYVLRYIEEAIDNRTTLVEITARAIRAYQGFPSEDGYVNAIQRYADTYLGADNERAEAIKRRCASVRPRKSMIVSKSIDSMVAQAMGGVGQFECAPYDPHFKKSDSMIDLLNEAAMNFYMDNHMDAVLPQMIEYAGLGGASYAYLGYKLDKRQDNGSIDIQIIPASEMLIDPLRSKRNRDRYIGFTQKQSWNELKAHVKKNPRSEEYSLESINEVDENLRKVEYTINRYHDKFSSIFNGGMEDLPHGLDQFYKASALLWRERNRDYLSKKAGAEIVDPMRRYVANDVEVSYLYDLANRIQFTVVNRRYIIEAKTKYLSNTVSYNSPVVDPHSGVAIESEFEKRVSMDHPFVALEYKRSLWQTYAYSPVVDILDLFDDICALESLIHHTISIMTPITFTGNPSDIEKLGQIAGVSGETIKGFISNSVTVLNKAVDLTPALSQITRLENAIADKLNGIDVREQSRMVGDRASAAEAMGVASLVSQGLNALLANLEKFSEELMEKVFKMTVIYTDKDYEYSFDRAGVLKTLSREDLAGDLHIRAKLKSKIKAEQQAQAANTMQWFVPLMGSDAIKNKEAFAQSIIPTLARGFSRRTISSWFEETPEQAAQREAQLNALQAQEEAATAIKQREEGIDPTMVDPSGGGRFNGADIANALAGAATDEELDMSQERSEPNKPYPTARKLQYGIGNGGPEPFMDRYSTKMATLPAEGTPDVDNPPDVVDQATELAMNPTSGGMMANDPLTGANSPEGGNYAAG